ncbi:glycoside hydrolase family 65 protein [Actinosynnema sp. NPDC059335]|uniref:glycoside hydrolase family 65 protein n=1 Tax=Actinosynnema sp. NPDC059335 TaxID=3346804 RepID=UPI00366D0915
MTRDEACSLCALADSEWQLSYADADPASEGAREALSTLANGFLATRGAAPEAVADGTHYPATYAAGVYNRLESRVDGRTRSDESLVNLPNWLPLTIRADGDDAWQAPGTWRVVHHHVVLDLRRGLLLRDLVVDDPRLRRTHVHQERLVSMDQPHLMALHTTVTPQNWSGDLQVRSTLDGTVCNGNVAEFDALAKRHLAVPEAGHQDDTCWLVTETTQSRVRIAMAARTTTEHGHTRRRDVRGRGRVGHELTMPVECGVGVTVDKIVAVFTSRDHAISEPLHAARGELADTPGFAALRAAHAQAWEHVWQRWQISFDLAARAPVVVDVRRAAHLHLFHVAQTLSRHTADLDAGVPARGLHGEGYRGHVFWDELFVFPLLNLRVPELTRALLLYRYRRLPQARRLARAVGAAGALFPWQSGSDGREETPERFYNPHSHAWMADNSRRQHHVNLAVAYNVWHYYQVTGDVDFLAAYGAELLVEIARFWTAIAEHDPVADRYHLRGVMGPDEFHDGYPDRPGTGVDDNAYVAVMTSWVLTRVLDTHEVLGGHHTEQLWQRLGVTADELRRWDRLSRRLHVPFLRGGLMAQFEGYDRLDELDWDAYRSRYGDIGRLDLLLDAEGDTTNRYRASKQADVLMLLYLLSADELTAILRRLGYDFDPARIPDTVSYYLTRTTHGSTLSRVVHAWVLSRGDRPASWRLLREALDADLSDTAGGTTREGVHLGAMAATADILQRCYTGLETRGDILRLHPRLPDELTRLDVDLRYRGHWLRLTVTHSHLHVRARPGSAAPITIVVDDVTRTLGGGGHLFVPLADAPPSPVVPRNRET